MSPELLQGWLPYLIGAGVLYAYYLFQSSPASASSESAPLPALGVFANDAKNAEPTSRVPSINESLILIGRLRHRLRDNGIDEGKIKTLCDELAMLALQERLAPAKV